MAFLHFFCQIGKKIVSLHRNLLTCIEFYFPKKYKTYG